MNGNFEHDPGSYPFKAVMIGSGYIVHFLPEMQMLHRVRLPAGLGAQVALRVNTQYRAAKAGGVKFAVRIADVLDLIEHELKAALEHKTVDGATAMAILNSIADEKAAL